MEHFLSFQFSVVDGMLAREETDWDDALRMAGQLARDFRQPVHVHGTDENGKQHHVMTVIPGECD